MVIFSPAGVRARLAHLWSRPWNCGGMDLSVGEARKREELVDSTEHICLPKDLSTLLTGLENHRIHPVVRDLRDQPVPALKGQL